MDPKLNVIKLEKLYTSGKKPYTHGKVEFTVILISLLQKKTKLFSFSDVVRLLEEKDQVNR